MTAIIHKRDDMGKKEYTKCKYWMLQSCPEKNNDYMIKTEPCIPPGPFITIYDIEEINMLCEKCSKFEPNQQT
jgi:hypothetical protein